MMKFIPSVLDKHYSVTFNGELIGTVEKYVTVNGDEYWRTSESGKKLYYTREAASLHLFVVYVDKVSKEGAQLMEAMQLEEPSDYIRQRLSSLLDAMHEIMKYTGGIEPSDLLKV